MDKNKRINKLINSGLTPKQACSVANFMGKELDILRDECMEKGFITGLGIVLQLVICDVWGEENAPEKAPEFVRECLDLYSELGSGLLTFDEISKYISDNSGVKINFDLLDLAGKNGAEMIEFKEQNND